MTTLSFSFVMTRSLPVTEVIAYSISFCFSKALRISAEALYVQAGILDERYGDSDVPTAVLGDPGITDRQKQVLLEIYDSFRRENDESGPPAADAEPFAEADREAVANQDHS